MFTLGLTGGIGSGKSLVAELFRNKGVFIVDADVVAREVVEPETPALALVHAHFGDEVVHADGTLNRQVLRAKIFDNPAEKIWLEGLLHPLIRQRVRDLLSAPKDHSYQCYCVPLLFEKGLDKEVDKVLVVDVPEEVQIQRASIRDAAAIENIKRIVKNQISRDERLKRADFVIDNSGSVEQTAQQVDNLHQVFLALSAAG